MSPPENGFNGYRRFERIESAIERLSTAVLTLAEQMHAMASHGQTVNEMMGKIADAQLRLSQTQSRLADAQLKLAEAQNHTEERLNALITLINELLRRLPQPDTA
jgi:predicted  nucleic acid-binding Zn-ribbon protein